MDNKEKYLAFIKEFKNIKISRILKELNYNSSSLYTLEYSLENMQNITNTIRANIINLYPALDNNFILDTKEKNLEFIKTLYNIQIKDICHNKKVNQTTIYTKKASEIKYKIVIDEIKTQLENLFSQFKNS